MPEGALSSGSMVPGGAEMNVTIYPPKTVTFESSSRTKAGAGVAGLRRRQGCG